MVSLRQELPRTPSGSVDLAGWIDGLAQREPALDTRVLAACGERLAARAGAAELEQGMHIAELMFDLNMDEHALAAALCYRAVRTGQIDLAALEDLLDREARALLEGVLRMASVRLLRLSNTRLQTTEAGDQIANIRAMITALIDDVRVGLIKLGERVVVLRAAKNSTRQRQIRIAEESQRIFAPLAGRLGIWHLKWELEDLALRYLDPDAYRDIAAQLDGRRAEREARVATVARDLATLLADAGLDAQVSGRAKHIYSIWRKMQTKGLSFAQVYDVRAVRVLLPDIAQCYSALGIIHTRWQHVPREFDDYIAAPKENGYRSIHTAVTTDSGMTLEVQLRTHAMHEEAELGVCAHWAYKDSAGDRRYTDKLDWLRQTLEWPDADTWAESLPELLEPYDEDDRVFVFTPAGHVIDLSAGATALDLAYRVHTEVGHSCIGASVDGVAASLLRPLRSGERVEIETGDRVQPELLWLDHSLEFAHTGRAREKIREFWRAAPSRVREQALRDLCTRIWAQLRWAPPDQQDWQGLLRQTVCADVAALASAVTSGDLTVFDLVAAQRALLNGSAAPLPEPALARLELFGENRDGLLRDVALLLSEQQVSLRATVAGTDPGQDQARIQLTIESSGFRETLRVLLQLQQVPGVENVRLEDAPVPDTPANL
ncbi:MAG: HD domain-containing protein [Pseudomonadota bacterium]